MKQFVWKRFDQGARFGIRWELYLMHTDRLGQLLGQCFYMPGSKRYRCAAGAPVKDGTVMTEYWAGTASAARKALERDWDKRSIGLFGDDHIQFLEFA